MKIYVQIYLSRSGERQPRAFCLGERRLVIVSILDRWLDTSYRYFRVRVDDGRQFLLRHESSKDLWELAGVVASTPRRHYFKAILRRIWRTRHPDRT